MNTTPLFKRRIATQLICRMASKRGARARPEEGFRNRYGVRGTFCTEDFVPSLNVTCTLADCVCFGTEM